MNRDAKKIRDINAKIVDTDSYTFIDHTGKEVTKTGAELKRYMLVMRNVVDFSALDESVEKTGTVKSEKVEKTEKEPSKKEKAALASSAETVS